MKWLRDIIRFFDLLITLCLIVAAKLTGALTVV